MPQSIAFIEEVPVATIFPNRVRMEAKSGSEVYIRVFERHLWRKFLETELRRLNDYERAEREERAVLPFRNGEGSDPAHG